jgi:hypothetical protein
MQEFVRSLDWLRLVRMLAQYIAPGLVVLGLAAALGGAGDSHAVNILLVSLFSFSPS